MNLEISAPRRIDLRPSALPCDRLGTREVVVEVERLSLCGSDYKLFNGSYGGPCAYPIRFGHEWGGTIIKAGKDVELSEGTRVTGDCSLWCGECDNCSIDRNLCRHIEKAGITRPGFSNRYCIVPERYLYADDLGLGFELLALTEITAVAARGIEKALPLPSNRPVLIVGAGSLGLLIRLLLIESLGASKVHLLEHSGVKTAKVMELFPSSIVVEVDAAIDGHPASYKELAARAAYPVVFECSGSATGLNSALRLADFGGTVVCLGLSHPDRVDISLLVTKGLRLLGSIGGTGAFPAAMKFLERNRALASKLITHRYSAMAAEAAFLDTAADDTRIKVQLIF